MSVRIIGAESASLAANGCQTHETWTESIIWLRSRYQNLRKIGGVNYLVAESISRSRFFC